MAGKSPAEALEAFIDPIRAAVQCVADADVFGSSADERLRGSLTFTPRGHAPGNMLPVDSPGRRRGDLQIGIYHEYMIVPFADPVKGPYKVQSQYYTYGLYDWEERELIVFHWQPTSAGWTPAPHVHITGARPFPIPGRHVHDSDPPPVDLSNMHIPTARMFIESFLFMLLADDIIVPHHEAWPHVLTRNLEGIQQSRTW